jgi:hypothetical protein
MKLREAFRFRRWARGIIGLVWVWAGPVFGQWSTQTVQLSNGWNAIYLEVEPADSRCDAVFSNWPVAHVSLYAMENAVASFLLTPDKPVNMASEFLTWIPRLPTGANALNAVKAGQAYLIYTTQACQRVLTGRPAVPRMEWVPGVPGTNVYNLMGFRNSATATFGTYLSGAGFDMAKVSVYRVGGTNSSSPTYYTVGGFSGSVATAPMQPGMAYFIACSKRSSFTGPVRVYPAGTGGIYFQADSSRETLRLKNEHGAPLTVSLTVRASVAPPGGAVPVLPALMYFDYVEGWLSFMAGATRTLQAGEEWTLPLAVDRTEMVAGTSYGGVLVCTDPAGGRVEIPLEAEYGPPDPTRALWPAGLWVGKASLDKVSQVSGNGAVVPGVRAGGTMEFRLILHVNEAGRCHLLQRVLVAGAADAEGNWTPSLYVDENDVPADAKSVRISSVAFGTKNNIVWDETYGGFGNRLRFTYAIAADDPVNPFRHPYHPDHDGLGTDFETVLPSGDDPQSYMGVTKPELFSISNTVSLIWNQTNAVAGGSALWNPAEQVSGAVDFQVEGLRREGPLVMQGHFELRRISQVGSLVE